MKNILMLILKNGDVTGELFHQLSEKGFNFTILIAKSLKHIVNDEDVEEEDHLFLNLRHLTNANHKDSSVSYFVLDDNNLTTVKNIIRKYTNNFQDVKGAMFSYKVDDFEGSI